MQVTEVTYQRLLALKKYNNVTIGITIQLDKSDDPQDAFKEAKRLVMKRLLREKKSK